MRSFNRSTIVTHFIEWLSFTSLFFFGVIIFCKFFIIDGGIVQGASMEPTLFDTNFFIVQKNAYYTSKPERGDIIQIVHDGKLIIKRVVGLPNETLTIKQNTVWINNEKILETYLPDNTQTRVLEKNNLSSVKINEHEFYVLGDNRNKSIDSRAFGPIKDTEVIGKIIYTTK